MENNIEVCNIHIERCSVHRGKNSIHKDMDILLKDSNFKNGVSKELEKFREEVKEFYLADTVSFMYEVII